MQARGSLPFGLAWNIQLAFRPSCEDGTINPIVKYGLFYQGINIEMFVIPSMRRLEIYLGLIFNVAIEG